MKLIALRHGKSQYNVLGLCNDDASVAVDLTADGVEQAKAAAAALGHEPIKALYSSPLPRARQTSEILAHSLDLPVLLEPRLGDIRSGFEGRPVAEYLAAIVHDPIDARVGGESLRDYAGRVGGFLDGLAAQPHDVVLLVAHEETLRVIHAYCDGLALTDVVEQPFDNCRPCCFSLPGKR